MTRMMCGCFSLKEPTGLPAEALADVGVLGEVGVQELERADPAQLDVVGGEDDADRAPAEHPVEPVDAAQHLPDLRDPSVTQRLVRVLSAFTHERGSLLT